ncbi:phage tail protein [Vaginisenegalia massiliensis]|uniref:phage tail protein n=1 Tax=Vaginisenegalia massiliensis TaxID=2058294 RepID=UPI000F547D20|nr:phage tail protein [Vaginisenegalia massiliensis]
MFENNQQFDNFEIVDGYWIPVTAGVPGTAVPLGCTGILEAEAETKKKVKRCGGKVVKERSVVEQVACKISGHINIGPLREIYGLTNKNTEVGVWAYGSTSIPKTGILTFTILDFDGIKKLIAFPNVSWASGLKFKIENGQDELAQTELEFSALMDTEGNAYYEAIESDVTTETIKTDWLTKFTPELVKKKTV